MKSLLQAVVVAAALVAPAISFAQTNGPLTRAQVRAELVQLEQTGWRPPPAQIRATRMTSRPQKPRWLRRTMRQASVAW